MVRKLRKVLLVLIQVAKSLSFCKSNINQSIFCWWYNKYKINKISFSPSSLTPSLTIPFLSQWACSHHHHLPNTWALQNDERKKIGKNQNIMKIRNGKYNILRMGPLSSPAECEKCWIYSSTKNSIWSQLNQKVSNEIDSYHESQDIDSNLQDWSYKKTGKTTLTLCRLSSVGLDLHRKCWSVQDMLVFF